MKKLMCKQAQLHCNVYPQLQSWQDVTQDSKVQDYSMLSYSQSSDQNSQIYLLHFSSFLSSLLSPEQHSTCIIYIRHSVYTLDDSVLQTQAYIGSAPIGNTFINIHYICIYIIYYIYAHTLDTYYIYIHLTKCTQQYIPQKCMCIYIYIHLTYVHLTDPQNTCTHRYHT